PPSGVLSACRSVHALAFFAVSQGAAMLRLALLGMWHTHADGIVRRVAENPKEFSLVGGYDPDAGLAAARRKRWQPLVPNLRLFDKPEQFLRQPLDGVVVEGRVHENLRLARLAL